MTQTPYNQKVEVSLEQFKKAKTFCEGIIAHRTENGKHFIKLMFPKYRKFVESVIN